MIYVILLFVLIQIVHGYKVYCANSEIVFTNVCVNQSTNYRTVDKVYFPPPNSNVLEECNNYTLSISHYQLKLVNHYSRYSPRPPLKQAYFVVKLPRKEQLLKECPAALILSYILVGEAELFTNSIEHVDTTYISPAVQILTSLSQDSVEELSAVWPINEAIERIQRVSGDISNRVAQRSHYSSVNFMVTHCHEDWFWIRDRLQFVPPNSALFVYEKCGNNSIPYLQAMGAFEKFDNRIDVRDRPDGEFRGDECSAFLTYLLEEYDRMSDYTILLQADPHNHLFFSYLDISLRALAYGSYNVSFLHLNYHRHVQTSTPCMNDVQHMLWQKPPSSELIGTYCCAQFIVSRERLLANSWEFYNHMLAMVDGRLRDLCTEKTPKRSSQCYVFEFLWHIVMGEARDLPMRPNDDRLPVALRLKYGNEHSRTSWIDLELAPRGKVTGIDVKQLH